MAREAMNKVLVLHMPTSALQRLRALAARDDRAVSAMARRLVLRGLEQEEAAAEKTAATA